MSFSLADSLSKTNISELIGSVVEEGDVYRMCLDGREGIVGKNGAGSRNKFFVLIGKDSEGNAFGFFLINTNINPSLPEVRKQNTLSYCLKIMTSWKVGIDMWIVRISRLSRKRDLRPCFQQRSQ